MPLVAATASAAQVRIARATAWLRQRAPAEEILIVAGTAAAASELVRTTVGQRGAAFGWHRATLGRLAATLAAPALVEQNLVPVGRLGSEAVAARVVFAMRRTELLGRYARIEEGPGLARAMAGVLEELRLARVDAKKLGAAPPELRAVFDAYAVELGRAGLADRAQVFALAAEAAREAEAGRPLLGLPTLLLDVPLATGAERALVEAIAARAPDVLATVPAGDAATRAQLQAIPAVQLEEIAVDAANGSLASLQRHLFEEDAPASPNLDDSVAILSAPGESRECVEIARRLLQLARDGVAFDRMAVLLRSPEEYRPHLEEAFDRAGIPAHFARGAVQPDPAGRAFVALLGCAADGLSARGFAEYLSLGEVPDADERGAPPAAAPDADRWVAPDEELVPGAIAEALGASAARLDAPRSEDPEAAHVVAGTLRAPRRWERLLLDAAVIGGRERWERRLDGLARELELDLGEFDDPEEPAAEAHRRDLAQLSSLRAYALPLLDELAALPAQATWGDWLDHLSSLATRSLRAPERVLATLAELAPMADVGFVELDEVRLVLSRRLLELSVRPEETRYGKVFVAPAAAARGLAFDAVFVPGLAEKLFPHPIAEEPILLDAVRAKLDCGLDTNEDRLMRERLALRLAVGAATRKLTLSYPRLDLEKSRPRVPSFYALEALRAAEGRLPGFDELGSRAETATDARVGWPAPERPEDAIDEAEHDLALLHGLMSLDPEKSVGTARYLLTANPHLGRALRFRARRWLTVWTPADGLVETSRVRVSDGARAALRENQLAARSFSPTALQTYTACPYRFFLYAVHRLAPREQPEAIDELSPLQRGALVHDAQFELFGRLEEEGLLPVTPARLGDVRAVLDAVLDQVAKRHRDDLAPAIARVWDDGVASVRADLREWLRRASEDDSGFAPWRFELAFGLAGRRARDARSVDEAVELDCGIRLRGSIDLVERRGEQLRVTDHKTGKNRIPAGAVVDGGRSLQAVLYALAVEKIFPDTTVEGGRLYFCTSTGGFAVRDVPLDERARRSAAALAEAIDTALSKPFLPAAPAERACEWCDYRVVCGPYEELRTGRKRREEIEALDTLRELP
ncbi:MAG: PD-(D/E)XK nuclease family protein [Myxococcales bacterium]|nr:PD-(D/E)XK nuclease family protein [Myxococcales bacterium]